MTFPYFGQLTLLCTFRQKVQRLQMGFRNRLKQPRAGVGIDSPCGIRLALLPRAMTDDNRLIAGSKGESLIVGSSEKGSCYD